MKHLLLISKDTILMIDGEDYQSEVWEVTVEDS